MITRRNCFALAAALLCVGVVLFGIVSAEASDWSDGGADMLWSNPQNWVGGAAPSESDVVRFGDAGSLYYSQSTTSILDASRTIAGLSFATTNAGNHAIDLNGYALHVAGDFVIDTRGAAELNTIRNGTLELGSDSQSVDLIAGASGVLGGYLDLTGAVVNANLRNVVVGQGPSPVSNFASGFVQFGSTTTLTIGSAATPGSIIVGQNLGSGFAYGTLDLAAVPTLHATLSDFLVGVSDTGNATGTAKLAVNNTIHANRILIGYTANTTAATSSMALGMTNTIIASEMTIGGRQTDATVTIPAGGSLTLGSSETPTFLTVGKTNGMLAGPTLDAKSDTLLDLRGATFNATLSNLEVGEQATPGFGYSALSQLLGGNSGDLTIGSPTAKGSFTVAHNVAPNGSEQLNAFVDLSHQTSLTANLSRLYVGVSEGGTSLGSLILPAVNHITADTVRIGVSTVVPQVEMSNVMLGTTNTILTPEFMLGTGISNGNLTIPIGGSLQLGSEGVPTNLLITTSGSAKNNPGGNSIMNLSGATFNATLNNLIVADVSGTRNPPTSGTLLGGNAGAITIGQPNNLANWIVGRSNSLVNAVGQVVFSGQDSLTASVNQMAIGVSLQFPARGDVTLAKVNTINAGDIIIGSSSVVQSGASSLTLGQQNSVIANTITVGGTRSSGTLLLPSGGTLDLGTADHRADLFVGRNNADTSASSNGTVDLSGGAARAYLGNVIIGEKSGGGIGEGNGVFTTAAANNLIDAHSIVLGAGTGSGTFNFKGGSLTADSIEKGTGVGQFNWTAGALHTQSFGTASIPFNLLNQGTGVLAPARSDGVTITPGLTSIHGSYTQGATAGMQITLGGHAAGTGYDQVLIDNLATLAGAFNVQTINGFRPGLNELFTVMTFGSRSGDFTNYSGLDLGTVTLHPSYVGASLVLKATSTIAGDVTLDGAVNIIDLTLVANHWLSADPQADANGDGHVDIQDVTMIANHWSAGGGQGAQMITSVPEPSTCVLALLSVAGPFIVARRKARRAR